MQNACSKQTKHQSNYYVELTKGGGDTKRDRFILGYRSETKSHLGINRKETELFWVFGTRPNL
jgi:hypothetical protein